jgi:hypothetical protein
MFITTFGIANNRNIARSAWYLAAWRLFSRPLMMGRPDGPKTRHSHADRRRFSITTSSIKDKSAMGNLVQFVWGLSPPRSITALRSGIIRRLG